MILSALSNITAAQANLVKLLKVESVSAINAKQIQVVFSTPVDPTTAKDVTNYSLKATGVTEVALTTATATSELSADGKTVTITLTKALTDATGVMGVALKDGDTFQVVTAANVKDVAKTQTVAKTTTSVVYSDTTKPEFVSATASAKTTTNKITLTFNEPVNYSSFASVTVNGTSASLSAGTKANEVLVTTGSSLTAGTTYNLVLLNFKDYAGNIMAINPLATTVTVTADAVAPVVTKVEVVRNSLIEVTFDKSMDAATVINANVRLLDVNLGTTGITQGTVAVKANTDNKTFSVPVTAVPFNTSGTFSGVVSFTNSIKDASGNALVANTQAVTLTKDTSVPAVVSATYVNTTTYNTIATTNGAIVVKFNEPVNYSAANTAYTVVDNLGALVASGIVAHSSATAGININPNDNTELVLPLGGAVATGITSYKIVMPTSAVVDLTIQANPSVSSNQTVDVSAGAPVTSDTTKPVVASVTPTVATSTTPNIIAVAYTEAGSGLNVATVIDTNNYRLDGAPLPSGTFITLSGTTATVTLPMGTIAKDKAYALNISAIADKAGNVMDQYIGSATLRDDIRPTMTSATLNTNGTISVGFDETMLTAAAKEAGLTVVTDGKTLAGTFLSDGVGADAGKYVITVDKRTVGIAASSGTVTDPNGATYTGSGSNVMKFIYIDYNGSGSFNAGDVVISAVDQGNTTAIADASIGNYDLNNNSSITITTTGTTIKDASLIGNLLKAATQIVVK